MTFIIWSFVYDCAQLGICLNMRANHFTVEHVIKYPDDYRYIRRTQDFTYLFACALLIFLTTTEVSHPSLPFWIAVFIWLIDCTGVMFLVSWTNHSLKLSFKRGVKKINNVPMKGKHFKK